MHLLSCVIHTLISCKKCCLFCLCSSSVMESCADNFLSITHHWACHNHSQGWCQNYSWPGIVLFAMPWLPHSHPWHVNTLWLLCWSEFQWRCFWLLTPQGSGLCYTNFSLGKGRSLTLPVCPCLCLLPRISLWKCIRNKHLTIKVIFGMIHKGWIWPLQFLSWWVPPWWCSFVSMPFCCVHQLRYWLLDTVVGVPQPLTYQPNLPILQILPSGPCTLAQWSYSWYSLFSLCPFHRSKFTSMMIFLQNIAPGICFWGIVKLFPVILSHAPPATPA